MVKCYRIKQDPKEVCNLCFNYLLIVKRVPKKTVVDQSTENVNITGSERCLR